MHEIKPIKTGLERFQAYRKAKGIPQSATLLHAHKIMDFEEQERKELRSAYEALQKENADLQLRLDAKTLSHQLMLDRTLGVQKENDDQKRKIISIENELVEWNEFKKIRDAQMSALRKQMP